VGSRLMKQQQRGLHLTHPATPMISLHSQRSSYVAAFILGALIALLITRPARSAEPFRLDRVAIVQFTDGGDGNLRRHSGVLEVDGRITWRMAFDFPRPANTPDWALGRNLIPNPAWLAYHQLGFRALENFELREGGMRFSIGNEEFHFVAASPLAAVASGRMINISTRARIVSGGDQVIAGFVIEERPRMVLVRAVGPSLARFGVAGPAPDPFLSVKRNGVTLQFNDNWGTHPEAAEVRAAAVQVGAFPLDEGSRDAARLLVLPPGSYTAHVETASPDVQGGTVLVEIYSVPDDALFVIQGSNPSVLP
jgi:hypothetical protein